MYVTFLSLTDEGTYRLEFIHVSEKALIAVNVDETGKKPEEVILFGMYDIPWFPLPLPRSRSTVRNFHSESQEVLTIFSIHCIRPVSLCSQLRISEGNPPRDRRS